MDASVLVEDGVVWDHEEQGSTIYSDDVEETLIGNNNETYLSVNQSNDDTQYFSVLETTSPDLSSNLNSISISNDNDESENNERTVIYSVEGTNDLRAVSVAYDSNGILRKFQYELRLNENGEYESLPETMELLPLDEKAASNDEETEEQPAQQRPFIKAETVEESNLVLEETESNSYESDDEQLHVDENEVLPENVENFLPVNKIELVNDFEDCVFDEPNVETPISSPGNSSEPFEEVYVANASHGSRPSEYIGVNDCDKNSNGNHFLVEPDEDDSNSLDYVRQKEELREFEANDSLEIVHANDSEDDENDADYLNELQANSDDFEIVDGVHITGDLVENPPSTNEMPESSPENQILKSQQVTSLKNGQNVNKSPKSAKNILYYVLKCPEKENLSTGVRNILHKNSNSNPRSLLKSSFKEANTKVQEPLKAEKRGKVKNSQSDAYYNSLAKATILHAPIRQQRLPRKQTITPVQREDEEIIVQEVVVSSKGFVETTQNGVFTSKVPLKPSVFVQLSDSDDYDPKNEVKRKKKLKKRKPQIPEIIITDSEDDTFHENIEIDLLEESDSDTKRKRGKRFQKSSSEENKRPDNPPVGAKTRYSTRALAESNEKSNQNTPDIITKTKWKCKDCPKIFPSQGSLKSHTQFHNFNEPKRQTTFINRHECIACGEKFKNSILLSKHSKKHEISKSLECSICKKIFGDRSKLVSHKRIHIKEKMFQATTLPKQSPKFTSKTSPVNKHKCDHCQKLFSTSILLSAHLKMHKLFVCSSCKTNFLSKLALEDHIRNSCVKKSSARFSVAPNRASKRISSISHLAPSTKTPNKQKRSPIRSITTPSALPKHNVTKTGFKTPNKESLLESSKRKSLRKKFDVHSSVPASRKLRNAHAALKSKLLELT